jgi:uncharacterized protein YidB (DUF937 family)
LIKWLTQRARPINEEDLDEEVVDAADERETAREAGVEEAEVLVALEEDLAKMKEKEIGFQ